MSNVIAKFHQDHKVSKVSNHEPTVTFQGGVSVSSISARLWFDSFCIVLYCIE